VQEKLPSSQSEVNIMGCGAELALVYFCSLTCSSLAKIVSRVCIPSSVFSHRYSQAGFEDTSLFIELFH